MAHIGPKENYLSYNFMKKKSEFSCLFGHNIISNGLCQTIRNNIVAKKTTELKLGIVRSGFESEFSNVIIKVDITSPTYTILVIFMLAKKASSRTWRIDKLSSIYYSAHT